MIRFKHSGNAGDILYSLYCIQEDATLYLHLNQKGYYAHNVHPLGDVMLNQKVFDMLKPLLLIHPYIKEVLPYNGEEIDYDLDQFRKENMDLGRGSITHWYFQTFPELTTNVSKALFQQDAILGDYIVVNRTFRYRNADVRYKCLNDLDTTIYFVGLPDEYEDFFKRVPTALYYKVDDFHQAAELIAGAQVFIGNQSMMFAIAELMNKTRILEVFKHAPNVIPSGGKFFEVINESRLEQALKLI